MKKLLLILISSCLFAQKIPEPNNSNVKSSLAIQVDEYEKLDNEFVESLRPLVATTKYGLGIITYRPTGDEYSTGATFKIYNPSKKTIKYIWFTVGGENPVGDLVGSKGNYYKTVKGIGPVESNGIAEWDFQYLWYTNIVETLRITTIKIQYMDNTVKTLKYNEGMYIGNEAYENVITALYKRNQYEEKAVKQIDSQNYLSANNDIDQQAEFPGGLNAFRNLLANKFDISQINKTGNFTTNLTFFIETDGSISDIKAEGLSEEFNSRAVATVKSIKNKWTPAKSAGENIRSQFNIQFKMNFE